MRVKIDKHTSSLYIASSKHTVIKHKDWPSHSHHNWQVLSWSSSLGNKQSHCSRPNPKVCSLSNQRPLAGNKQLPDAFYIIKLQRYDIEFCQKAQHQTNEQNIAVKIGRENIAMQEQNYITHCAIIRHIHSSIYDGKQTGYIYIYIYLKFNNCTDIIYEKLFNVQYLTFKFLIFLLM